MSTKTQTLPGERPVVPGSVADPPALPTALDTLEAIGRESADAAARVLEADRAGSARRITRCRARLPRSARWTNSTSRNSGD